MILGFSWLASCQPAGKEAVNYARLVEICRERVPETTRVVAREKVPI